MLTLEQALAQAQELADKNGINRLVFGTEEKGFVVTDQTYNEPDPKGSVVIIPRDCCDQCGRWDKALRYYEASGDGWDHTPEGTFCSDCRIDMVQSI